MLKKVLLLSVCFFALMAQAQEKKHFTLEDVMPGGKTYSKMNPANIYGLGWWGERSIRKDRDKIVALQQLQKGKTVAEKEEVLLELSDIKESLAQRDTTYKIYHLMGATFPTEKTVLLPLSKGAFLLYDVEKKQIDKVFQTDKKAQHQEFSPTHQYVAYTIDGNLYLSSGEEKIMLGKDEEGIVYGQSVHQNEFGIHKGTFWSPKGNALAFYRMDESMVPAYPQVNTTTRMSTLEPQHYPMAGTKSHKVTVGVYHIASGKTVYLKAGDPTDRYFTNVTWSPDEKLIYMLELNRGQNHMELKSYDALTGAYVETLYTETHPKYVEPQQPILFLPWDNNKFLLQTQRSGYNHLVLFDLSKRLKAPVEKASNGGTYVSHYANTELTMGDWLVKDVLGFNEKKKTILYTSTEISPLQTNVYAVNLKGKRTALDNGKGTHYVQFSPSGEYLIDNYTAHDVPREISLRKAEAVEGVSLLSAKDPLVEKFQLPEITLGTIKAADGKTYLYYRLIKPTDFDPNKKYPAIIYVYGGPHAQLITDTRFYGARGWDLYMPTQGYVMLTIDSRGSANRGLNFENVIHRQVGKEEMKDQMEGVKFLASLGYVDMEKIGVHGWSYGGFMTTNLMLTYADTFKVGVAGGPVIDWKYYEIMYGERYMDSPQENPEGYSKSNLKERAGDLKGRLQIIIGGADPVCLPQHSYTFLRACIDAGTQPDYFIYPESGHNMIGPERVHLYERITRYFKDFLK